MLAIQRGWCDQPDERRIHKTPIPRIGGIGISAGFFSGILFIGLLSSVAHGLDYIIQLPDIQLMLGALIMLGSGMYDDLKGLAAVQKLFF